MKTIEELIWTKGEILLDYSKEQWVSIVRYLLKSLESFLNFSLSCEESIDENVGKGFSIDIRSKNVLIDPLQIQCKGIIGGDIIDDPKHLHISVILFLYSRNKKLVTKNDDNFLYFNFKRNENGNGMWVCSGWEKDIYDEYGFFDKF